MAKEIQKQQEEKPVKMFDLVLDQPNEASAIMGIGWCLTGEGINYLRENRVKFPYMAIIISRLAKTWNGERDDYEVLQEKRLVPLDKGLEYVEFFKAGEFKVYAHIVYSRIEEESELSFKKLRAQCAKDLSRLLTDDFLSSTFFTDGYFTGHECFPRQWGKINQWEGKESKGEKIRIDESLFAPEPPKWLSWWVNLWNREYGKNPRPEDECGFRKRLLWAFSGQLILEPIFRLIIMIFRYLYALGALLVGGRLQTTRPLYRPYGERTRRMFENVDDEDFWWITNKEEKPRSFWFPGIFTIPLVWIVLFLGLSIHFKSLGHGLLHFPKTVVVFFVFYWVVKATIFASTKIMSKIDKNLNEKEWARLDEYYYTRLEPLACTSGWLQTADFKELPETHRTFTLRFWSLKQKLCRPYQKK